MSVGSPQAAWRLMLSGAAPVELALRAGNGLLVALLVPNLACLAANTT
jgi:hypothetical protein